jgi:membrane fusion protein, multidrug efflux system
MSRRLVITMLSAAMIGTGCSKRDAQSSSSAAGAARPAVPVLVAQAVREDVPVEITAIGTVEPLQRVTIKPQLSGELSEVHFREGDDVKQGDLLFTIDPRPYEIALQQARAALAADSAMAKDARELSERLASAGSAAVQRDVEAAANKVEQTKATLLNDQAAIDNALLRLTYTQIRSPISGRTGTRLVDRGNIVKENETELLTIMQIEPVCTAFAVPENLLGDVRSHMKEGDLKVVVTIPGDASASTESGELTFIDNAVDRNTGTIPLKATFPNANRRLWPGSFVNVVLRLTTRRDAVVIPSVAVQVGQKGQYVFIVAAGDKAEMRPVAAGVRLGERTVIESGLSGGETIVTDGQMRLAGGMSVSVKAPATQPAVAAIAAGTGKSP